ncbi:protein FAM167A [Hemiscyllium ocellatum]|uniref:protein FAM167A n=1 Tax=Hemiscyllium ocellatum TaxID=170820 RepID=UPI0029668F6C|nr:protein FAM167A [Hemiscyllium ocellatum]
MEPPAAEADPEPDDHLSRVKALTAKLNLQTRRPSFAEWQQKLESEPWKSGESWQVQSGPGSDSKITLSQGVSRNNDISLTSICGFASIGEALEWLRKELREMQSSDHQLARKLICLRREIHRLKVEQICHQHKEMLDDVTYGLEECEEESDLLLDIPLKAVFSLSTPLKHIGVTKMNINSRRFSLS